MVLEDSTGWHGTECITFRMAFCLGVRYTDSVAYEGEKVYLLSTVSTQVAISSDTGDRFIGHRSPFSCVRSGVLIRVVLMRTNMRVWR